MTEITPKQLVSSFASNEVFDPKASLRRYSNKALYQIPRSLIDIMKQLGVNCTLFPERIVNLVRRDGKIFGATYYFIGCHAFPCLQYVESEYIDHLVRDFCMNVKELGLCTSSDIEIFVSSPARYGWLLSEEQFRRLDEQGKVNPVPRRILGQWNVEAFELKHQYMKLFE